MKPFPALASTIAVLPVDHIDTDQIIPARFLRTTCRQGLGVHAFHDWRTRADGRPDPDFCLNRPEAAGAQVLVAGDNFGCGSSREHAAWALVDLGFRAVVASSFADIFRQNALKNGLLPIAVEPETLARLQASGSGARVVVDLEAQTLTLPRTGSANPPVVGFSVDPFARRCLLLGVDELGSLLGFEAAIADYETRHPARFDTRASGGPNPGAGGRRAGPGPGLEGPGSFTAGPASPRS